MKALRGFILYIHVWNLQLKSSLRRFYSLHHDMVNVMEYLCHKWPRICSVCRNHNPVISTFVTRATRRAPHLEQELLILPELLSSPPVFSGVHNARSLVFCVMFCRSSFVLYLLAIVLSVLLRFTASDYSFGIFVSGDIFCV